MFLAIDAHRPALAGPYLGEDHQFFFIGIEVVGELVGLVVGKYNLSCGIVGLVLTDLAFEFLVDDGRVAQVGRGDGAEFVVGTVDVADVVGNPSVAEGTWVKQRLRIAVVDDVFGVQHVHHRLLLHEGAEAVARVESLENAAEVLDFRTEVTCDDILITTQFGARVAADGLVEIGRAGVVEDIFRQVNHPEVKFGVAHDVFVGSRGSEGHIDFRLIGEIAVVQVTTVDGVHVDDNQGGQEDHGGGGLQFAFAEEEDGHGGQDDENQAAQRVFAENGNADLFELAGEGSVSGAVLA